MIGSAFAAVVALGVVVAIPFIARDGDGADPATPSATATATGTGTGTATAGASPTPSATATSSPGAAATSVPSTAHFEEAFPDLPDLERPIAMVELLAQDTMLVALQEGRIIAFPKDPGAADIATVLDQVAKTSRSGNEEGLLSIALDPGFDENGYLWLYYSAEPGERRTVLSRITTSGEGTALRADPATELVILTVPQPFSNHNGGTIVFGQDGMLYLSLGDGGSGGDPNGNGQDLGRNLLGSVIRIDVRDVSAGVPYSIPADNPFVDDSGARPETWAYGFRNPWRMSMDRETGAFWTGDVGQSAREEVDLVVAGGNYGWNITEGTRCYRPASGCDREGLIEPAADYARDGGSCSVTGGYVYRGQEFPALRGVYFYADFCSGMLWGLLAGEAAAGRDPQATEIQPEGPPIASFAEDAEGELYGLAFDGRIYRLVP